MDYQSILNELPNYLHEYFQTHADERYVYHNEVHTQCVVNAATQMAKHYNLNEQDFFIVVSAAWFHDTGYFTQPQKHEIEGSAIAEKYLQNKGIDQNIIDAVKGCIVATHMPQNPKNLLEQIVCDADLFHLGTEDFPEKNKLMRKEVELIKGHSIDKEMWRNGTIGLLESHHYFTDYAQQLLNTQQAIHLQQLKDKQAENTVLTVTPDNEIILPEKKKKKKNKGDKKPDKGIETMFRVVSGNNQRLSNMADNKAHIMISVNSIILSAIISLILKNLHEHIFLAIPTFMILTTGVLTIIFSVLAMRPSIPQGTFTQTDIDRQSVNLLFFGNFYKMSLEEYTEGMWKVMDDRNFLYGSLIKDVYFQGVVLGRKYHLLRLSYNVFMFGLIISVLGFIIAATVSFK